MLNDVPGTIVKYLNTQLSVEPSRVPRLKGLPFRLPPSASPLIPRAVQVTPEPRPGAYLGASLPPGFNAGRVVVSFSDLTPVSLRLLGIPHGFLCTKGVSLPTWILNNICSNILRDLEQEEKAGACLRSADRDLGPA